MKSSACPVLAWFLIVAPLGVFCRASSSPTETLWRIGVFDSSSDEFRTAGASAFWQSEPANNSGITSKRPVFVVGKSDPTKDWPPIQPGTGNGPAGYGPHPIAIEFDLISAPNGVYTLQAALLVESPGISRLQVEINGHVGWFYRHPTLTFAPGSASRSYVPILASETVAVEMPAGFLKKGRNQLILTAVDEPADPYQTSGLPYSYGHPQIVYDALEMIHSPRPASSSHEVTAEVRPTIFYKSTAHGLTEQLDVYVRFAEQVKGGQVALEISGAKFTKTLISERDFGEELVEFDVPELVGITAANVVISVKGRTRRFSTQLAPEKKWTIFVVPYSHLDIGYTDYQAKVAELHSRMVDQVLDITEQQPDFRFSLDGYWIVDQFLASRSEAQKERLTKAVANNRVFVPAQYANLLTGAAGLETLIRSLYHSFEFAIRSGGRFDYANITDVPSYSWSYASVLASAGLRNFVAGANDYRGPIQYLGRLDHRSPFWWEGPDGARVLMWYSRMYCQLQDTFGFPARVAVARESLPIFLQAYSRPDYKSDAVILNGTQGDNVGIYSASYAALHAWNELYGYPKIQFSGFSDALQYIGRQQAEATPVIRGDGNPYWEDGIASDAHFWSLSRESEQRVLSAEKLSTVASLINPNTDIERDRFDRIWKHLLLMTEHTWEASGRATHPESEEHIRQREAKRAHATEAKREVQEVLLRSMSAVSDYIPADGGTWSPRRGGTLVVFNPVNWKRSGMVELDVNRNVEIVDGSTGEKVPFELLYSGKGFNHVRFLAQGVPSLGFKCYLQKAVKTEPSLPETQGSSVLENDYYSIRLDPESGAILSIFDKELNKQLVDSSSPYRFGQYLYVSGGDELPNRLNLYSPLSPLPKLQVHGAQGGRLVSVSRVAFGTVAHLTSSGFNTPQIETEIVLFNAEKKIQISYHVQKERVYTMEAVYFAFPFAMDRPLFRYSLQNGFVDPEKDQLPGAGKEWFTAQHWVTAGQDGTTVVVVPVDAPLFTLGDIVRGTWPTEFGRRPGWIFSYAMNNYWPTNFVNSQGGDFTFRYLISSTNGFDPAVISRFGWEALTPLELNAISPFDKTVPVSNPIKEKEMSFVEVDADNVVMVTWKKAENGNGTILRFVEVGGRMAQVRAKLPLLRITSAWETDAVERNQHPLELLPDGFAFDVKPFQIMTVRVEGSRQ